MRLQKLYALEIFMVFFNTLFVYGMEPNSDILGPVKEAKQYNGTNVLLCLPHDVQQHIVFLCGSITQVTEDNADEVSGDIKFFCKLKRVCTYFNEKLVLPWINLGLEEKNRMVQKVNLSMTELSCKECLTARRSCDIYFHDHPEKVLFGYKKYRIISLALVCAGVGVDITDMTASTTLLSKAVHAGDQLAVALLLNYNADPYQMSFNEDEFISLALEKEYKLSYNDASIPICFRATTVAIVNLFLEKIDMPKLLNTSGSEWIIGEYCKNYYSSEVMEVWLKCGISARYIWNDGSSVFHTLIIDFHQSPNGFMSDDVLKKIKLLVTVIPDMINIKNDREKTPLDVVQMHMESDPFGVKVGKYKKIIELLRENGGKTAKELELEDIQ